MESSDCLRNDRTRTSNPCHRKYAGVAAEEDADVEAPIDRVMVDIRRELVLRVTRADRDEHRDIYDALADE